MIEGKAAMIVSGAIGGLILGLIEGVNLLINRYQSQSIVSDQSNKNHCLSISKI
jgi:hypothetical protein